MGSMGTLDKLVQSHDDERSRALQAAADEHATAVARLHQLMAEERARTFEADESMLDVTSGHVGVALEVDGQAGALGAHRV